MSNQPFIKVIVEHIDDGSFYYNSLRDWEKRREFNAVEVHNDGDDICFSAGGHKYRVDTRLYNVQMFPFVA